MLFRSARIAERFPDACSEPTINVAVGRSVDVVMDFTDPIIRGMSVFHCHLPLANTVLGP